MKKLIITVAVLIAAWMAYNFFYSDCDVLPKDNYRVVLENELYTLTPHGLIDEGCIVDYDKAPYPKMHTNKANELYYTNWISSAFTKFSKPKNTIYFSSTQGGVMSLNLTKHETIPAPIPGASRGTNIALSPNGNLLLFTELKYCGGWTWLLDLKTGKKVKLINDFIGGGYMQVWINDHQFFYTNNDSKIICFDINSLTSTDMHLEGYDLGEVSPDGKNILLSGRGEATVLYNLADHSTKVIMNKRIDPNGMIWLPDGKGFLHLDNKIYEIESYGLNYYSMGKHKSVRLMNKFSNFSENIATGFFVPPNVEIKLPDSERNRTRPRPMEYKLVKVCK